MPPSDIPTSFEDPLDPAWELRLRLLAIPVALLLARALVGSGWRFLVRVFLSMWVHELGHAAAAWLAGFPAFPGPWFTPFAEHRSLLVGLLVSGALVAWCVHGVRSQNLVYVALGAALLLVQLALTFGLSMARAQELFLFAGDGGCFVIGTALMCTFYAPPESPLRTGWLRWGFLFIGAAAFADAHATWWGARHDFALVPLGENEGAGLSDASRLTDDYGWTAGELIHRYVALAWVCLAVLALVYAVGLFQARRASQGSCSP